MTRSMKGGSRRGVGLGVGLALAFCGCKEHGDRKGSRVTFADWAEVGFEPYWRGAREDAPCRRTQADGEEVKPRRALRAMTREVRQSEFEGVMGFNPSFRKDCPDCPVDSVTFDEAALYCARLGDVVGLPSCYRCEEAGGRDGVSCRLVVDAEACAAPRLPTGEEYERFARAGTRTGTFGGEIEACMGNDPVANEIGWYKANSKGLSQPVGQKKANALGLYDVAGNVAEWVHPDADRALESEFALLAGGSWFHNAHHMRAASRLRVPKNRRFAYAGFRCVQTEGLRPRAKAPPLPPPSDPAQASPRLPALAGPVKVAAVVDTDLASPQLLERCGKREVCRVEGLVREAAEAGAKLVVTAEYALEQEYAEPVPEVGSRPATDEVDSPLVDAFARVADESDVYVVMNVQTYAQGAGRAVRDGGGAAPAPADDIEQFNTVVALGPDGEVVGRHHKFELYGGERDDLTPGDGVATFETPFGRVGLLVCADIYGQPAMHHELMRELDARVIAWSAAWTVEGATRWQSAFARDWNVFFIAANGAKGAGAGAGIFGPDGQRVQEDSEPRGPVIYGWLPM